MSRTWRVRLTRQAESDFIEISRWTAENFGALQTEFCAETVTLAIEALRGGPEVVGTKARDEIARGIRTLHVTRQGRKGRHFVVFRAAEGCHRPAYRSHVMIGVLAPGNDRRNGASA